MRYMNFFPKRETEEKWISGKCALIKHPKGGIQITTNGIRILNIFAIGIAMK